MVRKKTGDVHPCVDFRRLNSLTLNSNALPIPRIEDSINALAGSTVYSVTDFLSACCQPHCTTYINISTDGITDGITNRCGSFYMSLCASCFAAPLVAVRLNYKFVTKSYVFTDHFNQSNFHFVTIQMFLFISDILFLCLIFPKYNLSICIVHF